MYDELDIAKNGMIYTTPDPPNPLKKGELD
jgi:hypothetical protein